MSRHGVPSEVLSDRGQAFLSGLMQEVGKLLGFHKQNTTAYHPHTNGLVKRVNRTLTTMLAICLHTELLSNSPQRRHPFIYSMDGMLDCPLKLLSAQNHLERYWT